MRSLINKKQVREFALACASKRAHKFTRVGKEFLFQAELALRGWLMQEVARRPSKGITL